MLENEPRIISDLLPWTSSWLELDQFRTEIRDQVVTLPDVGCLYEWMWNPDPTIARLARIVLLFQSAQSARIEVLGRLTHETTREIPFIIDYNSSEREYSIGMDGVPGWGVSRYGNQDADVARLLELLDTLHAKM